MHTPLHPPPPALPAPIASNSPSLHIHSTHIYFIYPQYLYLLIIKPTSTPHQSLSVFAFRNCNRASSLPSCSTKYPLHPASKASRFAPSDTCVRYRLSRSDSV